MRKSLTAFFLTLIFCSYAYAGSGAGNALANGIVSGFTCSLYGLTPEQCLAYQQQQQAIQQQEYANQLEAARVIQQQQYQQQLLEQQREQMRQQQLYNQIQRNQPQMLNCINMGGIITCNSF